MFFLLNIIDKADDYNYWIGDTSFIPALTEES